MEIKVTDVIEFGGGYVRGKIVKIENDVIDVECPAIGLNKNDTVIYSITKDMILRTIDEKPENSVSIH